MNDASFPAGITWENKYRPAMEITEQAAADAYFERCVEHTMESGRTWEEAEVIEKANIGYWAGHYDDATRARVERLFRCTHPVLGAIAERKLTPAEILARGMILGRRATFRRS